jgi:hypothetical protein
MSTRISAVCRVAIGLLLLLSACSSKNPRDQNFGSDAGTSIDLPTDNSVAATDSSAAEVTTTDDAAVEASEVGASDDASDATSDTMDVDASSAQDTAPTDADSEEVQ